MVTMIIQLWRYRINVTGQNKFVVGFLSLLPLLILLTGITVLSNQALIIFPADNIGDRIWADSDQSWRGNSRIEEFAYDNKALKLRYILKEGLADPKVFFSISLGPAERPFDLSGFDSVTLRIKEATPKRVVVFVKTYLPGISRLEPRYFDRLRHNQYVLQLNPEHRRYTIRLKDFVTPPWWVEWVKFNRELLPAEAFKKVVTFDLHFPKACSNYRLNKHESIIIEKISFHRKPSLLCYITIGMAVVYSGGLLWVIIFCRREPETAPVLPQGITLNVISSREKELLRIKEFIENHYMLPEISTQKVAEEVGISQGRVIELLKEEYQLTFKQLIHKLRINEAKRLLNETDLRITEIALNLGFNSVSYFNNLFKQHEQITPSEYREQSPKS